MRFAVVVVFVALSGCQYAARPLEDQNLDPGTTCETSNTCTVCYNGARLVSSSCPSSTSCSDAQNGTCQECRDTGGNLVSSNCPIDCGLCIAPTCAAGEALVTLSGSCCPVCLSTTACDAVSCDTEQTVTCPGGQHAERNPANCCAQMCVVDSCDSVTCSAAQESACPSGYELDPTAAPCCSVCVPKVSGGCIENADCDSGLTCIAGICHAGVSCQGITVPNPAHCQGFWRIDADTQGCPTPPVCYCDDLLPAIDGFCSTTCRHTQAHSCTDVVCENRAVTRNPCDTCCVPATAVCMPPPQACHETEDCEGVDPASQCVTGYCTLPYTGSLVGGVLQTVGGILTGVLTGQVDLEGVSYNGGNLCTNVPTCRADQVVDFGAGCCPTCHDVCLTSSDCSGGQNCVRDALSQCAVQACQIDGGGCTDFVDVCYGVCK